MDNINLFLFNGYFQYVEEEYGIQYFKVYKKSILNNRNRNFMSLLIRLKRLPKYHTYNVFSYVDMHRSKLHNIKKKKKR